SDVRELVRFNEELYLKNSLYITKVLQLCDMKEYETIFATKEFKTCFERLNYELEQIKKFNADLIRINNGSNHLRINHNVGGKLFKSDFEANFKKYLEPIMDYMYWNKRRLDAFVELCNDLMCEYF